MASTGKRVLVRWNDDHDKELLLWIVYCCTEAGVKIPFDKVAYYMGTNFSEGAIVQHLAKVRTKMEESGLHCPPTQKRGTVVKAPSKLYRRKRVDTAPAPRSGTQQEYCPDDDEEDQPRPRPRPLSVTTATPRRQPPGSQSRRAKKELDIKQESDLDNNDPDAEYGSKSSRRKRPASDAGLSPTQKRPKRTRHQRYDNVAGFDEGEWDSQSQMMQDQNRDSSGQNDQTHQDQWNTDPLPASWNHNRNQATHYSYVEANSVNSEDEEDESGDMAAERGPGTATNMRSHNPSMSRSAGEFGKGVTQGLVHQILPTSEPKHGLEGDLSKWHFGGHSTSTADFMGPPAQPFAFSPNPRPAYFNPYATGPTEPMSRMQSFASSNSNMSIENQSLYGYPFKDEPGRSTTDHSQSFIHDTFESNRGNSDTFAISGTSNISNFFDDAIGDPTLDIPHIPTDSHALPPYDPSFSLDFDNY